MESLVAAKVPLNLATSFIDDRIFEAYRWIEQQGAFTWNVVTANLTIRNGTFFIDPTDMPGGSNQPTVVPIDVGKPIVIYGSTSPSYTPGRVQIPYVSPDKIGLHQLYHTPAVAGFFSCFTIITNAATVGFVSSGSAWPSNTPYIQFAPSNAAVGADSLVHVVYHQQPKMTLANFGANTNFFPTPDAFDDLIVNLAVAFIKEIYSLMGGNESVQKAQAQISQLLDKYRTDKKYMEGLMAEANEAQETQAQGAS